MRLEAQCPRCADEVTQVAPWTCSTHGNVVPLWRAAPPDYEAFVEHLRLADRLPTWVPWPLPSGWQVTDFGAVAADGMKPTASFVTVTGMTELDGVVDLTMLVEEPGIGLGARCAGSLHSDPGVEITASAPATKVRLGHAATPLWLVPTDSGEVLDRVAFAGESDGRWVWMVLRPASAAMMVGDLSGFVDASTAGPELLSVEYAEVPRGW